VLPITAVPESVYVSATESHRLFEVQGTKHASRESLPSIHEALSKGDLSSNAVPEFSSRPQPTHKAFSSHFVGRFCVEGMPGPLYFFS
jgi:hypothetical protein